MASSGVREERGDLFVVGYHLTETELGSSARSLYERREIRVLLALFLYGVEILIDKTIALENELLLKYSFSFLVLLKKGCKG